jgi:hypothetical protein
MEMSMAVDTHLQKERLLTDYIANVDTHMALLTDYIANVDAHMALLTDYIAKVERGY